MIYLASRSPRRRLLLRQIGITCRLLPVDLSEARAPREDAATYASRMAREKAECAARRRPPRSRLPVLGADTVVVLDGEVLGKPRDREHARELLGRIAGREHEVLTAVALVAGHRTEQRSSRSRVWLRPLSAQERAAYCATDEPLDKAGAYAVQGLAAAFVSRIEGSYSGVMGLPLFETAELLAGAGIELLRAPRRAGAAR